MATGYHQLGILAQARGDYDSAEQRYTQSLEINERLGNQAGMAISHATLALLMIERGNNPEAIRHELHALSIRTQMRSPEAGASIQRLAALRSRLGVEAFTAICRQLVDEPSLLGLTELLAEQEASGNDPQAGSG